MWIANRARTVMINAALFERCSVMMRGGEWCIAFSNETSDAWAILDMFASEEEARSYFINTLMRYLQ